MKTDLNLMYSTMESDLAPTASSLGGVIIAVSFMEAISVFCLLIVILRYKQQPQEHVATAEVKQAEH